MGKWDKYQVADSTASKWEQYAEPDMTSVPPIPRGGGVANESFRQDLSSIVNQPAQTFQTAKDQFSRNPIAGGLNFLNAGRQAFFAPAGIAFRGAQEIPFVGQALGFAGNELGKFGQSVGNQVGDAVQNLAPSWLVSKENMPEVRQAVEPMASDVAQIGLMGAVGIGVPKVAEMMRKTPEARGNVAFNRAFPTTSRELSRPPDMQRMIPYLKDEQLAKPVKPGNIAQGGYDPSVARQLAEEKFPNIKQKIYSQQDAMIQKNANAPLSGGVDKIATEIESLRNIFTKNVDVLKDNSILTEADKYRKMGSLSLSQGRDMLHHLNANLQSLYKQSAESQIAAENIAKPIAEMEKAASSLRNQIVTTLNDVGADGKAYKDLSLDYGAAARIEAVVERNIARHEAPLPPFMTQTQSQFYPSRPGAIREIGEQTVGRFYTPEKLAHRAMKDFANTRGR